MSIRNPVIELIPSELPSHGDDLACRPHLTLEPLRQAFSARRRPGAGWSGPPSALWPARCWPWREWCWSWPFCS